MERLFKLLALVFLCIFCINITCCAETNSYEVPRMWSIIDKYGGERVVPVFFPEIDEVKAFYVTRRDVQDEGLNVLIENGISLDQRNIRGIWLFREKYSELYGKEGFFYKITDCINDCWKLEDEKKSISAQNQTDSLADLEERLKSAFKKLYGDQSDVQIIKVDILSSLQKTIEPGTFKSGGDFQYGDLTGVGGCRIYGTQIIDNIPVFTSSIAGFKSLKVNSTISEVMWTAAPRIIFEFWSKNRLFFTATNIFETIGEVKSNFKLCEFNKITDALEKKVEDEEIQCIYSLKFGYVVYADPNQKYSIKDDTSRFVLYPMWIASCSYGKGKSNLSDMSEGDYERQDLNYQLVFIDPETAQIYNPNETNGRMIYAPDK